MNPQQAPTPGAPGTAPWVKPVVTGCIVLLVVFIIIVGGCVWMISQAPDTSVRTANNMDQYALDYISEHELLNEDEALICYYDASAKGDGTEAAILTDKRILYHKEGRTTAVPLTEVADVQMKDEGIMGMTIRVKSKDGELMQIIIAALSGAETFHEALLEQQGAAKGEEQPAATPTPKEQKQEQPTDQP